jgi:hypothetical protein
MKKYLRSCDEISADIAVAMKRKKMTLESCVGRFNSQYKADIQQGLKAAMNKDFLQRVRTASFKVVSARVIDLCKFLDVNPYISQKRERHFELEFAQVEQAVKQRPELEPKIKQLLHSITDIVAVHGA